MKQAFFNDFESASTGFKQAFVECGRRRSAEFEANCEQVFDLSASDGMLFSWVGTLKRTAKVAGGRALAVLSSGVHGIEGFAGSAIQSCLLNQDTWFGGLSRTDFCFIHGVNPWGMLHRERTDSDNVDLNRNSHSDVNLFQQKNPWLFPFLPLLSPNAPVRQSQLESELLWFGRLLAKILKNGVRRSTLAATGGHYQYPDTLFYGGASRSQHLDRLLEALRGLIAQYDVVTLIDFHTGLGKKSEVTLLLPEISPADRASWELLVGDFHHSFEVRREPVVPGVFSEWLAKELKPKKQGFGFVYEVGTLGKGGLRDNLRSLRRMVRLNQGRHWGWESLATEQRDRELFQELFFPSCLMWREQLLRRAQFCVPQLLSAAEQQC